jgi:hypothetical protein
MGQIEALEGLAQAYPRLNGAFLRTQDVPAVVSGTSAIVAGRNDSRKYIYNDDTLDCRTGGSVAAATLRRAFRATAIATPLRHCAGAKPCW